MVKLRQDRTQRNHYLGSPANPGLAAPMLAQAEHSPLGQQQTLGNQALQRALRPPTGSKQTGEGEARLSPVEEDQVRQWIQSWKVNRGLVVEPLHGDRPDIETALAEGIVARRLRLASGRSLVLVPETDPEVKMLAQGPIAHLYEELVPCSFDALTPREQLLLRGWLVSGQSGLTETLTGERGHDLDVLARGIFELRLPLDPRARRDPLLGLDPNITRKDPRYRALLVGPVAREHDEWDSKLRGELGKAWVRGEKGEPRDIAIRRLSRLYTRYGIRDWPKWYTENIKPAHFLGMPIVGGLHHKAVKALEAAEARIKRIAQSEALVLKFPGGRAFGGGYNARGWNDRLGAHSLGMAFDVQSAFNIEVRGAPGIAWATYDRGKNLMFAVKYLTGFDMHAFVKRYAQYEYDIQHQRKIPAERREQIEREIHAAAQASARLEAASAREVATIESLGLDAVRWEEYGTTLLKVAETVSDPQVFPPLLAKVRKDPKRAGKAWHHFLATLRKSPLVERGFFNIPIDVVGVLTDPLAPANLRFHWVPFHHFQLANWRDELKAEGVQFPK